MTAPTDYEIARAQRNARLTAAGGRPLSACPYDANGDPAARVLALRWVQAYLAVKPLTAGSVDYGDGDS